MAKSKDTKRKIMSFILIIISIAFLSYIMLKDPKEIRSIFLESNKWLLLTVFALQILSFAVNAVTSNTLLDFVGEKTSLINNFKISIMNEFGNKIMPIAGGSITSYIAYKRLKLSISSIIFLETAWVVLLFSQYVIFFILSALIIPHNYISLIPKVALLIFSVAVIGAIFLWYFLIKKNKGALLHRIIEKIIHVIRYVIPFAFEEDDVTSKIVSGINKLEENFPLFFAQGKRAAAVFFLFTIYFLLDITMLYISFLAFGTSVPYALVIFGYLLSLLLSLLTLIPGQPGVTEASLVLIFSAFGIESHNAILATLLFRLVSYWIWVPIGIYLTFSKHNEA
jgi:uncharacterized protein (TIRG00374 family)